MAVEFIHNAKTIQQDLIKLDWAIKREVVYKATISSQEAINQKQAKDLANCQASNGKLTTELSSTKQQLGQQELKTKQAKLEVWAMRVAVAIYIGAKIMAVIP